MSFLVVPGWTLPERRLLGRDGGELAGEWPAITSSLWSETLGIPVAVLGLAYFIPITALVMPAGWRQRRLDPVRIAGAGLGVATALDLVRVELFRVNALCRWCAGVHFATLVLLGTVLWRTGGRHATTT